MGSVSSSRSPSMDKYGSGGGHNLRSHSYGSDSDMEKARLSIEELSTHRLYEATHTLSKNPSFAENVAEGRYNLQHKSEHIAISRRIPEVDAGLMKKHRARTAKTLAVVFGGWAILMFVPIIFKTLAVKHNLAASDRLAVWVKSECEDLCAGWQPPWRLTASTLPLPASPPRVLTMRLRTFLPAREPNTFDTSLDNRRQCDKRSMHDPLGNRHLLLRHAPPGIRERKDRAAHLGCMV